ncbi:MAG: monofunctional biosynthetic peptidoglycan transglycosylase [Proteobacteria bacterium]|nr:monofunctional biosynthetic peptidoglycan transglycosylase [Pseudomonadota bacterium]NBX86536.1 monofunctional biosynthetic peptidoglycan transglycosylase [Pseudomonadota bacterium]
MRRKPSPQRSLIATWLRRIGLTLAILIALPFLLTPLYSILNPPLTPLMVIRLTQGHHWHQRWTPLNNIPLHAQRAVMAAEDNLFCQHEGFDWKAISRAYQHNQRSKRTKGASTISQQTAKNLFLWPQSSWLRKGLEVPLTWWLETTLSKPRILELYLNIAEWGPGVYGIEAAAKHHFNTRAKNLTPRQSAQLAAILPSPLRWSAKRPGPYVAMRAGRIQTRSYQLGPLFNCIKK